MPKEKKTYVRTCARGYHAGEFARRVRELFQRRQRSPRHLFGRYHDLQELKLSVLFFAKGLAEGRDFSPAATFANLTGEDIRREFPEVMQTLRGVRFSRAIFQKAEEWVQSEARICDSIADFKARLRVANAAVMKAADEIRTERQAAQRQPQAPELVDLERAFSELRVELERTRRTFDGTPPEEPEDNRRDAGMYQVDQGEPPDPADWWKPGFRE